MGEKERPGSLESRELSMPGECRLLKAGLPEMEVRRTLRERTSTYAINM